MERSTLDLLGNCGLLLIFVALFLFIWGLILFFRQRPRFHYIAYLLATLFPVLLGLAGGCWSALHELNTLEESGGIRVIAALHEFFFKLLVGSSISAFFFPIGIVLFWIGCSRSEK
jgi:hypothetical protein